MMTEKMQKAMNQQLNRELYSAYLYLAMSAYFENHNLSGFAHWMRVQAREEEAHAMKFYRHLVERGGRVVLSAIESPPKDWKSPLAVFQQALEHEQKVTKMIHDLLNLARAGKDHAADAFLQWFVKEQVEEEFSTNEIVQKLNWIGESAGGLLLLDHELSKRKVEKGADEEEKE